MSNGLIDVQALSPALPEWLRTRTRPPWIAAPSWKALPEEDRQAIFDEERQAWVDWLNASPSRARWPLEALTEATALFFGGLSQEGRAAEHPILPGDAGRGVAGAWRTFGVQGAAAAQYLNLKKMLGSRFPNPHFNLCGQLSVISLLGVGVQEGLQQFVNLPTADGDDILADPKQGTLGSKLKEFFEFASGGRLRAEFQRALDPAQPVPRLEPPDMLAQIDAGASLLALVNIDRNGRIKPMAESVKKIAHWVGVIDVVAPRKGAAAIRVYNPFPNREEFYTWPNFRGAWKATQGNASKFAMVIARPV
jgi:hypothetical protein